ncbi:MAG: iron-sulfur cluster assembly accessory protein [Actinobacteria bacterium]|nr:iron-sulfur cluster assembly accessory protein [Actinomycetota bacterium]
MSAVQTDARDRRSEAVTPPTQAEALAPTPADTAAESTSVITLTEKAAEKVSGFLADEPDASEVALRVAVQAGGCAGFRYALFFDDRQLDGDVVESHHGVTIRVDKMSSPYIQGSVIDWKETLEASGFAIENPNASGTCACGDSATF